MFCLSPPPAGSEEEGVAQLSLEWVGGLSASIHTSAFP